MSQVTNQRSPFCNDSYRMFSKIKWRRYYESLRVDLFVIKLKTLDETFSKVSDVFTEGFGKIVNLSSDLEISENNRMIFN